MNIIQKPSPNFSSREGYKPELVVIHIMAGSLIGTDSWFANPVSQVSSHYGVGVNGEIHQYVKESDKAWHAGRVDHPSFKLYKMGLNPNLYTIGIEHEGQDLSTWNDSQLQVSANLLKDICVRNNIPIDREHIIGHYQVYSLKPDCPGTNKTVIDKLINMAKGNPQPVTNDNDKIKEAIAILQSVLK